MDKAKARAASMPNPLGFLHKSSNQDKSGGQALSARSTLFSQRFRDPNCTDARLLLNQKCVYERQLPGNSYITAHISRLQKGYYDSPVVHGDRVENCRFVALNFVFHPVNTTQRFVSAKISISLQDKETIPHGGLPLPPQIDHPNNERPSFSKATNRRKPKFLRHAPHLLYGSLSPETLDWTFNLAGSLGVSQGPANASINPSGGVKSSYKVYKMMKIQGSVRTLNSWYGHEYDVEDGSLVWTLEENELQKSGLPREFTFVMLLTKGDATDVHFDIDIDPVVGSWYGTYPKWWIERIWYRPMHKEDVDIDVERGQRFGPSTKKEGFNFASLMGSFDDFVTMPGTVYSRSDNPAAGTMTLDEGHKTEGAQPAPTRQLSASPTPQIPSDLNIRVFLEGYNKHSPFGAPKSTSNEPSPPTPRSGFVISSARKRGQGRPRSEHFPTPPLQDEAQTTKPRPVSAIYELSTAPFSQDGSDDPQYRPLSAVTDISDDLFLTPLSPVKGLRISKSLRHSRSRPDLRDEDRASAQPLPLFGQKEHQDESRVIELDQDTNHNQASQPDPAEPTQNQPEAKVLPRYPRRIGAQPMRRTSNTQPPPPPPPKPTSAPSSSSASSKPMPLRSQDPNTSAVVSHLKRMTPRQARNSAYINPVDLNHARFKLAEDSPTLPPPPQPLSFPPTSYPNFAPTAATSLNSNPPSNRGAPPSGQNILPPAPVPPPAPAPLSDSLLHGLGVDSLVQQEVSNYLKAHPELYSPQSSVHSLNGNGNSINTSQRLRADSLDANSYGMNPDLNSSAYHNFSMPGQVRPSTASSSRAGPSSSAGGKKSKHSRSQSMQPATTTTNTLYNEDFLQNNNAGRSSSYDASQYPNDTGKLHRERSFDRERNPSSNSANGEFIRVSLGGVGHGGWEYLE